MKKRQNLILKSFGAGDLKNPDPLLLAEWIGGQKKVCCDLISYKIESQVKAQKNVADVSCSGGIFYRHRIFESLLGIKSGFLIDEPFFESEYIKLDAERVRKISRDTWFSFPPPSGMHIEDNYYKNRSDFIGGMCSVFKKIMREQRDLGIKKHILVADFYDKTELDELSSERVFFFSPKGGSKVLESILEYQNRIAVFPEKLAVVFKILDEYEIKNIAVIDGSPEDFESCLNYFDPEDIFAGGFCNFCEENYWVKLKERAFLMR
ncbi:MAG: hypothetical protein JXQ82_03825 [Methanomicrobiaceae archaeon]|nr:hypothetical protein [Methanomicrobiaceae archaeon]